MCPRVGVHWRRSLMSLSLLPQHVLFVLLAVFKNIAFRICSKQHAASWCSSDLAFSPNSWLKSWWCSLTTVLTRLQFSRTHVLSYHRDQISIWSIALHTFTYTYIFSFHLQSVSFYHSSAVWIDSRDTSSRNRNPTPVKSAEYLNPGPPSFPA